MSLDESDLNQIRAVVREEIARRFPTRSSLEALDQALRSVSTPPTSCTKPDPEGSSTDTPA